MNVGDHYSIGTWDKVNVIRNGKNSQERICELYRFPSGEWCEQNTLGFNPHKTRSFINSDGERVIMPPCPIKIWQGTADTTVDPVFVEEYVRAVRRSGSYIELHLLDGVGHHLTPVMREEIGMWFDRFI